MNDINKINNLNDMTINMKQMRNTNNIKECNNKNENNRETSFYFSGTIKQNKISKPYSFKNANIVYGINTE